MRLTLKLGLAFMLANMALAVVYGYMAVQREVAIFHRQVAEEAEEMEPVIQRVLADAWSSKRDAGLRDSLRTYFGGQPQPMRVRWVWFDAVEEDDRPVASAKLLTAVALQEHLALETEAPDGTAFVVIYWPMPLDPDRQGGLEFCHPVTALTANQREIIWRTGLLIGGMALISGLLAVVLGIRIIARPLQQVVAKARLVSIGNFEGPLDIRSHDELAELADDLNKMCRNLAESQRKLREESAARIAAIEQLRHADRLKTVGRLASGIAHELGTPLNVVSGRAGLIASGKLDAAEIAQSAAAIRGEADKMTRIIRQLLDFARSSTPRKQPIDLRSVVRQTIDLLDAIAEKQKVRLQLAPGAEDAVADIDAGQIQQMLTNLTMNAIQAMPQGGPVEFRIGRRTRGHPDNGGTPAEFFAMEIEDQGVGISAEHIPQLFEPFFTTKEVGAGTGLGLSIAYGIVQEHGGWIEVASRVGEGSCFTVFLPAEGQPLAEGQP
jgi:two-component system NtrC family sensor kinase